MTIAAKKATPAVDMSAPENWEWDVKTEGAAIKVIMDTIGDVFIGKYTSKEYINNEPAADGSDRSFYTFNFRGIDDDVYTIGESYALTEAMEDIEPGTWCRITYVRDIPTKRKLNPMKAFKVETRK